MDVKKQIQKCWCEDYYENIEDVGAKNIFNKELKENRKELQIFYNKLTSANMGDFSIRLDKSVCGIKKRY
jgi:hypothetical protein